MDFSLDPRYVISPFISNPYLFVQDVLSETREDNADNAAVCN